MAPGVHTREPKRTVPLGPGSVPLGPRQKPAGGFFRLRLTHLKERFHYMKDLAEKTKERHNNWSFGS